MLKVIAEDVIKPEHVETVRPLYAELVRLTRQEPLCRTYDLFEDRKQPGHFIFIENGLTRPRSTSTAPASISGAWSPRSTPTRSGPEPTSS